MRRKIWTLAIIFPSHCVEVEKIALTTQQHGHSIDNNSLAGLRMILASLCNTYEVMLAIEDAQLEAVASMVKQLQVMNNMLHGLLTRVAYALSSTTNRRMKVP